MGKFFIILVSMFFFLHACVFSQGIPVSCVRVRLTDDSQTSSWDPESSGFNLLSAKTVLFAKLCEN